MVARKEVPKRLFDALDQKNVGVFLRYWSALPASGRTTHPLGAFVWAALSEIGEQLMTGVQRFASDQRVAEMIRRSEAKTHAR